MTEHSDDVDCAAAAKHPLPKPGEAFDPHYLDIAKAYNLAAMLADALDCMRIAHERLSREYHELDARLLKLENHRHPDALYSRGLPDGREITVYQHNDRQFGVGVGPKDTGTIDSNFYYATAEAAVIAAVEWTGRGDAPVGWFRHPQSGRRRVDGDPMREEVRP